MSVAIVVGSVVVGAVEVVMCVVVVIEVVCCCNRRRRRCWCCGWVYWLWRDLFGYVVVAVIAIIYIGLMAYLYRIDQRVKKLEK